MVRYLILCFFFLHIECAFSDSSSIDPSTISIHPDESTTYTQNSRFSTENAIKALKTVNESLTSFRKLTEAISTKKTITINNYEHTDWEMQHLGFSNLLTIIEGTIRRQGYLLAELKYKLAIEKKNGYVPKETDSINNLKKDLQDAKNEYEAYLKSIKIVD